MEVVLLERGRVPGGGQGQDHREIFGPGARHHRVHRHLLDGVFPVFAELGRAHAAHHLVGLAMRALEHRRDALLGRQHDRQKIGPVILEEKLCEIFLRVGRKKARRRALERQALHVVGVERPRQALDDLLHEGPAGDRVLAFDVGAQIGGGFIDHRLRHVGLARLRHAVGQRRRARQPREHVGVHGHARHARFFQRHRQPDDRRATGASQADAEDGGVALGRDLGAHLGVVDPALARLDEARLDRGQVLARTSRAARS